MCTFDLSHYIPTHKNRASDYRKPCAHPPLLRVRPMLCIIGTHWNIGRTRGSGGRAHGFRWSEARFLWVGVQCDRSNVYILYFDDGIRTEKFLEKKTNHVVVSKKIFFQIFENDIFCQIFTPSPGPIHQIRDFLSYDPNSFYSS